MPLYTELHVGLTEFESSYLALLQYGNTIHFIVWEHLFWAEVRRVSQPIRADNQLFVTLFSAGL